MPVSEFSFNSVAASDGEDGFRPKISEFSSEGQKATREQSRVLVVDDEHMIADTFAEILAANGFNAEIAYSATEAVDAALKKCPDIVLADVVMPEKTGIELAIILTNICPTARILLMSGQASTTGLMRNAARDGYNFELLAKPLPPELLLEKLKT